jgi:hypothetical protein
LFKVRGDVTVPGHGFVAGRDAFDAVRRQIEHHLRIDDAR